MQFEVKNRHTGEAQFTAEIQCSETDSRGWKLRLAIQWALSNGASLRSTNLRGAYLVDADLSNADLSDADLRGADLKGANLTYAKLGDAPVVQNIHQKIYDAASQKDALDMGDWHICDTTHCRAGWAIHLAGEAGYDLERKVGSAAAGAAIYLASDPGLAIIPNFYATNEEALADMKRLAEQEAANPVSLPASDLME